jgi:putative phosphoesterase
MSGMKIAVLADSHIPKRARDLPAHAWNIINSCEAIIHAGDVLTEEFLKRLRTVAPLYAVRGNNDLTLPHLPQTLEINLDGCLIAVIHDSGDKKRRAARLRKRFPNAQVVVFGHSHIPQIEWHDGQLMLNPGSATDRRMQPHYTMAVLHTNSRNVHAELIKLER